MTPDLHLQTDPPIEFFWTHDDFDIREGFNRLVFGLDVYEEGKLAQELGRLLDLDLNFLRFNEGKLFQDGMGVDEFREALQQFRDRLTSSRVPQEVTYPNISKDYLSEGLIQDLDFLLNFCAAAAGNGARLIRFAAA